MATIKTHIKLHNGMTPGLQSITKSLNLVITSFEAMNKASKNSIDTSSLQGARTELRKAEVEFKGVENQIDEAKRSQQGFNQEIRKGKSSAQGLGSMVKRAAMAFGAYMGVSQGIKLADTLTQTAARLNLMNDGLQSTAELQEIIFQSAERSRGSYIATAQTVSKLGVLANDAFSSTKEMVTFAEQLNKQFVIGGAGIQEQKSAMYQLTQAMAAGRLQGDEFRSITENAPLLAQAIANQMNVSMGALREMSREGLITSDVIKNALLSSADETSRRFEEMPKTFGQVLESIKNRSIRAFEPLLARISAVANTDKFDQLVDNVISGVVAIASVALAVFTTMGNIAAFMRNNWAFIEPVLWGIVAALVAYKTVAAGVAVAALVQKVALAAKTKEIMAATTAQTGLNASILANPLMWKVAGIMLIIALIAKWVKSIGGLRIAWMKTWDVIANVGGWIKVFTVALVNNMLNEWDNFLVKFRTIFYGIQNIIGDTKANGLTLIQDFINGIIGHVNRLISILNKIPGVSIDAVANVSFATSAQLENEAKKQARDANLAEFKAEKEENQKRRLQQVAGMIEEQSYAKARREHAIEVAKFQLGDGKDDSSKLDGIFNNTANTALNTAEMRDAIDISNENLEYMRDIAEQEVINRFTTAEIKIDMANTFGDIRETVDIDGVVDRLGDRLHEEMTVAAEGAGA
ncbi:MAG: tape measure protein [Alkaliphilus sp.]